MRPATLIDSQQLALTINRLCYQLIENHDDFSNSCLVGIQPRGVFFAQRIVQKLEEITGQKINYGALDITFFRDDFRREGKILSPNTTEINFIIENKNVVLIDDVMYTGRTIKAALEALNSYGRPRMMELMVLVDRRFRKQLPIDPTYIGRSVDSYDDQRVKVEWVEESGKDRVLLLASNTADE